VNYLQDSPKYGILACVNGTGILNSWLKNNLISGKSYDEMNQMAGSAPVGTDGVIVLPFGNGAERTLNNRDIFAHFHGLRFNTHHTAHLLRAAQEGIVFALKYSFDIMQNMGLSINTVRAGKANMFLSPIFQEAFANTTGATVELYNTDGAQGAARGAGIGAGIYQDFEQAFSGLEKLQSIAPDPKLQAAYAEAYDHWLKILEKQL
jgi:xylulokinase